MAAKSSIVSDMIWNWVIETLATSEQVDASTLTGLVKMAPLISSDHGKDARETVSLRILESLFLQGDEAAVDTTDEGQNGKISFDSSERCENVLQQILRETPGNSSRLEKEKWNVGPFLAHKRSSLPKCALKKLKEAILENSHPLLTSLEERGKLVIPNASENETPVNDANFDLQDTIPKNDSAILNPKTDKVNFQEADKVGNVHHDIINENLPQQTHDKRVSVNSIENSEFVANLKENNVKPNFALDDESLTEEKTSMEHDKDQSQDKVKFQEADKVGNVHHDINDENVSFDNMENLESVARFKDKNVCVQQHALVDESSSEEEEEEEEENFMEHEGDQSQTDSLVNCCVKCNSSGELLECSSDSCPLHVHERCLGFEVSFDENGNFFCPYCTYSRAISKYQEAKRKASQARKDLQSFSSFIVKDCNRPNLSFNQQSESEKNEERKTGEFGDTGKKKVNEKVNESDIVTGGHESLKEQSEFEKNEGIKTGEFGDIGKKKVNEKVNEGDLETGGHEFLKEQSEFEKSEGRQTGELGDISMTEGEGQKKVNEKVNGSELVQKSKPKSSTLKRKFKEKESQRAIESSCTRELRKRKTHNTSPPAVRFSRRKIIPWTKSEEETLKEGVERYSNVNDKKIPWKEILDFGHNVFHKGRTTIDLKDKWRNICKTTKEKVAVDM